MDVTSVQSHAELSKPLLQSLHDSTTVNDEPNESYDEPYESHESNGIDDEPYDEWRNDATLSNDELI